MAETTSRPDYFQVFDLPRRLSIDSRDLEKSFYRKSRAWHPDLFATASAAEQQQATEQTSLLNDAYRALRDPWSRTEYLLALETGTLHEEKKREQGKPKAPPELLEEAFDMNMQLEELRMDAADDNLRKELIASREKFAAKMSELEEQLGVLWVRWDADVVDNDRRDRDATLKALEALLDRRRYVRNLLRDASEALGE